MYERPNPADEPLPDDETTTSPHGDELEELIPDQPGGDEDGSEH